MKVGITTCHYCNNYGAVLQATALVQHLSQEGHDARIIDLRGSANRHGHLPLFRKGLAPRAVAHNLLKLSRLATWRRRLRRFEDFVARHERLTEERYRSEQDAVDRWPELDAYVTGSDQVWNTAREFNRAFFLTPAKPERSRLISYAASFGTETVPPERSDQIAGALRRLHAISVRERSAQRIVRALVGVEPELMPDPVFLKSAEQWRALETPCARPDGYVLLYAFEVTSDLEAAAALAKKRMGLPLIQVATDVRGNSPSCDHVVRDAGPAEFLHLLRNASFVCTNSFHGTAFSLLLARPFVATVAIGGRNTRLQSVLETFGETDRQPSGESGLTERELQRLLATDTAKWSAMCEALASNGARFLRTALAGGSRQP